MGESLGPVEAIRPHEVTTVFCPFPELLESTKTAIHIYLFLALQMSILLLLDHLAILRPFDFIQSDLLGVKCVA